MSTYQIPKLTLVGAGPGAEDLITLRGIKALQGADVVLYDALVNPTLLEHAKPEALKVYVGKRRQALRYTQEQINTLIVDLAFTHGHVVRLKGGDPHVFGRGNEELQYADSYNIDTEFIPGISSAIGVAGLAGIPVTQRGISESVWVVTGTTREGTLSDDVLQAARSNATVVILMGVHRLDEIVEIFKKEGKAGTAIAVIQNGSLPGEQYVLGTVDTIATLVAAKNMAAPAIMVVGEVVRQHSRFQLEQIAQAHLIY